MAQRMPDCPECGSDYVVPEKFGLRVCLDCGHHFEDDDPITEPHREVRRMREKYDD